MDHRTATTHQPAFEPQQFGRSVSLDQACAALGVSRRTVYNWIRDGRLQTIRTLGGSQRVLVDSLRRCAAGLRPQTAEIPALTSTSLSF